MTFALQKTNRNFSTSQLHEFVQFESGPLQTLVAVVNSYASAEAYEASHGQIGLGGQILINWQDRFTLPATAAADPEAWLISPEGPFAGATVVPITSGIELLRSVKWAQIKQEKMLREKSRFIYLGKNIQTDDASISKLQNQAIAAANAVASNTPYVLNWTASDNSVLTMDGPQVAAIPAALAAFQDELHQTAMTLRTQLYDPSTDTIEKIKAISWPL